MDCVSKAARAVRDAFNPEGLSVWQSNGPAAFQEVPHLHFHVHPRMHGDQLLRVYPEKQYGSRFEKLESIAEKLRAKL